MSRNAKKVFSKTYNTKVRRPHIDYDYLDQLSEEEIAYLAKFTDEFYGAGFEINDTYVKKQDIIPVIQGELAKLRVDFENNTKKIAKYEHNLKTILETKDKMIKIKGNSNRKNDIDLRKCQKIDKYYLTKTGKFSNNKNLKYNDPIHKGELRKKCNDSKCSQFDIMGAYDEAGSSDVFSIIDFELADDISTEDYFILNEEIAEIYDTEDFDEDDEYLDLRKESLDS